MLETLKSVEVYYYLAAGGAAVIVLAIVLYFLKVPTLKVAGVVLGIVGGLGVGAAAGVLAMASQGYHWEKQSQPQSNPGAMGPQMGIPGGAPGGAPGGPGGARQGGPPGMAGPPGGGRGPSAKTQLAGLVTKLDVLTQKPLQITLSDEQKEKVRAALEGLAGKEELSEDEAKEKLDALLAVVEKDRDTLEAAGYRWPGGGGGGGGGGFGGQPPPNPFTDQKNGEHLKELEKRVGKAATP